MVVTTKLAETFPKSQPAILLAMNAAVLLPDSTTGRRGPQRHSMLAAVAHGSTKAAVIRIDDTACPGRSDVATRPAGIRRMTALSFIYFFYPSLFHGL